MSNTKMHRLPMILVIVLAILLASVMSFSIIDGVSAAEATQKTIVADGEQLTIGQFSDIHYFPIDYCYHDVTNPNYVTSDFYNSMTGDTKLVLESGMILAKQVKKFIEQAKNHTAPHYVFATGDLSKNGEHTALVDVANSLRYMQNEVRQIEGYENFQVFTTPGNHDLYNASGALYSQTDGSGRVSDGVSAAQFALIFAGLGYPDANLMGEGGAICLTDIFPENYWSGTFTSGYHASTNASNLNIHYYNDYLEKIAHDDTIEDSERVELYYQIGDSNNVLSFSVEILDENQDSTSYSFIVADASDRVEEEIGSYARVSESEYEYLKAHCPDTKYFIEVDGHLEEGGYIDTENEYSSGSDVEGAFLLGDQVYRATGQNHLCGGRLTEGVLNWMEKFCGEQNASTPSLGEETIVAAFHQNALPHWEQEDEILKDFTLYNWEYTSKRILNMGIHYVMTGHMHASDAMSYTDEQGRTLYDFQTGSCVSYDSPRRDLTITRYNCDGKLGDSCVSSIQRLDNEATPLKEVPSYNVFTDTKFDSVSFTEKYQEYLQAKENGASDDVIAQKWQETVDTNPNFLAYMIQYHNGIGTLSYNDYINHEIYSQLLDRLVSHFLNQDTIDSLTGKVTGFVDDFADGTGAINKIVLGFLFPEIEQPEQADGTKKLVRYILDTVVGGNDLGLTYEHNGKTYDTALGLVNDVVGEILAWTFGDESIVSEKNAANKGKMSVQDIAAFILTAHTAGVEISLNETYDTIDANFTEQAYGENETYRFKHPTDKTYRKRMLAAVKDMQAQLQSGEFVERLLNALLDPIFVEDGSLLKSILGYHFDFEKAIDAHYLTEEQFNSLKKGLSSIGENMPDILNLASAFLEKYGITVEIPESFSLDANDFCLLDIVNDLLPTIKGVVAKLLGFSLDGPDVISIVNNFLDSYMVDSFYIGLGGIAEDIVVAFATDVYPDLANFTNPTQPTLFQPYDGYEYAGTQLSYLSSINYVSRVGAVFNAATQENGRVPSRVTGNFDTTNSTTAYTVKFYTGEDVYGTFRLLDKDGNVIGTVSTEKAKALAAYKENKTDYLDITASATFDGITVEMLTQTKPQYIPLIDLGLLCLTHGEIMDDNDTPYVYGDRDKASSNSVIYWNVHTVTITGLKADTTYYYDIAGNYCVDDAPHYFSLTDYIGTKGYDKNYLTFTTAKDVDTDKFEFLTIADIQGMIQGMYDDSHQAVDALLSDERTNAFDFILNAGDMCDNGKNFNQWGMALNTYQDLNLNTSTFFTSGNHENNTGAMGRYFNYTALKDGEAQKIDSEYYSFDYANAHFTVLDTNDATTEGLGAEQLEWLTNDLKNTTQKWKFVLMHKSLYSAGSHATDGEVVAMRSQLSKLFAENGVNMVFAGHDHTYTTTVIVDKDGNAVVDEKSENGVRYTGNGVVYITLGTLGTKYYTYKENDTTTSKFDKDNSILETLDSQTFGKVIVDGDVITFTGYYYNRTTGKIDEIGKSSVTTIKPIEPAADEKDNKLMVILLSTLIPGTAVAGTGIGLGVHFGLKKKKSKISA